MVMGKVKTTDISIRHLSRARSRVCVRAFMCVYVYIYMCVCVCVCVCMRTRT